MTTPKFEKYDIPTWALGYLINGDRTGLEDGEITMINDWTNREGVAWVCTPEEEDGGEHFDPSPAFGLGAMAIPCWCAMRKKANE